VSQDEPLTGGEDKTSPDAFIGGASQTAPNEAYVRAERRNSGDGRVYRISFSGTDGNGGSCSGTVKVSVPRKSGVPAIDSAPPAYDSLAP
jgi:hypothetical protein